MPLTFRWDGDKFAAAKWFDHWTSLAQLPKISITYCLKPMFAKSASSRCDSVPDRSGVRCRGTDLEYIGANVGARDTAEQSCKQNWGLRFVVGCC